MKRSIFALPLILAIGVSAASADSVTVETFRGPVEIETAPQSTFVYDMAALDTLDALGVTNITSVSQTYLPYLSEYQGEAGTLFEPDIEAIHAAAPDLVILGGRSIEHLETVQRIAPAVDMTIWGTDLVAQGLDRLAAYGTIYGLQPQAAELRQQIEAALADTRAAVAGQGNALIVMTNGPRISAYGSGSRFGWLHAYLDLPEAVPDLEDTTHGQAVSFEFLREADPDWLLVIDRVAAIGGEGASAQVTLDNALVREMRAWQQGRVIYLDAGALYIAGGGVQSILAALTTLRTAFDAEARVSE